MPAGQEDVLGLDVAVNHAMRMGVRQRVGDLAGERHRVLLGKPPVPLQPLAQGLALDERHDEIRQRGTGTALDHAGIKDGKNVRVLQPGGELDLAEEAFEAQRAAELGPDHLERHRTPMPQVLREIDRRHPAGADLTLQEVALTERLAKTPEGLIHEGGKSTG
jgi:hypothetical protein